MTVFEAIFQSSHGSKVLVLSPVYASILWASHPAPRCSFLKDPPGPSVVSWTLCPPPLLDIDLPIMAMFLKLSPVETDTSAVFHRMVRKF